MRPFKACLFAFLFLVSFPLYAGEIYTWTDKSGVEHITDTPPPDNARIKSKSFYKRSSPQEIEAFQRRQRAATERGFAGWKRSQMKTAPSPTNVQDDRDERAKQLIEGNKARIEAVEKAGIKLPSNMKDTINKAAEIRAQQIRDGTARPMSAAEDAAFHSRQAADQAAEDAVRWHKLMEH